VTFRKRRGLGMSAWLVLVGLAALVGCGSDDPLVQPQPPKPLLVFSQQPTEVIAGLTLIEVRVTLMDTSGAVLHTPGTVTLMLETAPLGVSLSPLAAPLEHGVATFKDVALTRAGRYVFEARLDSLRVLSQTFIISAGPPGRLSVEAEPTEETVAGERIAPSIKVTVQDAYGNDLPQAEGVVTASLVGEGGTLSGTLTAPLLEGVATFSDLSVDRAGPYTLAFRHGLEAVIQSRPFRITPGAAVALRFWMPPSDTRAGEPITPAVAVAVVDRLGNVVTHASTPVTLALADNPGGGTLGGTLTVSAVQGVATFPDLSVQGVAEGYTLEATGASLASARSDAFDVLPTEGLGAR